VDKILELDRLIEAVLNNTLIVEREETDKTMSQSDKEEVRTLRLPTYTISESWGIPDSSDRAVIDRLTLNIGGEATIQSKFDVLESFITDCDEKCRQSRDTKEIISNLVLLNSLASMITDFNAQTAGFLMEAFLAALVGNKAAQISLKHDPKKPKQKVDIADIIEYGGVDGTQPMRTSIKFLASSTFYIEGSQDLIEQYFEKTTDPLRYILIQKGLRGGDGENSKEVLSLSVYEFYVGNKGGNRQKWHKVDSLNRRPYFDYRKFLKNKTMVIPQSAVAIDSAKVAVLSQISKGKMREITEKYIAQLQDSVVEIFNALDELSNGINDYLLSAKPALGTVAQEKAENMKTAVDNQVEKGNKNT